MKIKRFIAMLLSVIMALSLAACSSTDNEDTPSGDDVSQSNATQEPIHLNLAESWGFEYFYTVITPDVTSSGYDLTYWLPSFYDTLVKYDENG